MMTLKIFLFCALWNDFRCHILSFLLSTYTCITNSYIHGVSCIYTYKTVSNISFSESPFRIQLKKQITKSIIHAHMKLGRNSNSISDLIYPKTPAHLSSLLTTVKRRFFTLRSFTANLNIIVLSEWNYYK